MKTRVSSIGRRESRQASVRIRAVFWAVTLVLSSSVLAVGVSAASPAGASGAAPASPALSSTAPPSSAPPVTASVPSQSGSRTGPAALGEAVNGGEPESASSFPGPAQGSAERCTSWGLEHGCRITGAEALPTGAGPSSAISGCGVVSLGATPFSYGPQTLSGTSGSATLSLSGTVSASVTACIDAELAFPSLTCSPPGISFVTPFFYIPGCLTPIFVSLNETWNESVSATLTASSSSSAGSSSGLNENDLNSPLTLAGPFWIVPQETVLVDVYGIPILEGGIGINVSAEYQLTLGAGSSITVNQGSTGWANQTYTFATKAWSTPDSITCAEGDGTISTGCTTATTSPSFTGSALFRIGPQLILSLSLDDLVGLNAWAFLYGQASLYFGLNDYSTSDYSNIPGVGGQCGSGVIVSGMGSADTGLVADKPYLASNWWGVLCAAVGFQFGASWNALASVFSGQIGTTVTVTLYAAPVATTVQVCDVSQEICTDTFTNSNPDSPNPSWTMQTGQTDQIFVYTPLQNPDSAFDSIPVTWSPTIREPEGTSPCGTITDTAGSTGEDIAYQAPSTTGTCQLTVNTGLFFGVSLPSFQINSLTFDIKIVTPTVKESSTYSVAGGCWVLTCLQEEGYGIWSIALDSTGNGSDYSGSSELSSVLISNVSNGEYDYQVTPPPGLRAANLSGEVDIDGSNLGLPFHFEPISITFNATGLGAGDVWGATIDGVERNETTHLRGLNEVVFLPVGGNISYAIDAPGGYSASPASGNLSVGPSNGYSNITINVTFTPLRTHAAPSFSGPTATISICLQACSVIFHNTGTGEYYVALDPGIVAGPASENLTVLLNHGYYNYSIDSAPGYVCPPFIAHSFKVTRSGEVFDLNTTAVLYPLNFTQTGLPSTTTVTVTVHSNVESFKGTGQAQFNVTNGTVTYAVTPVPGYTIAPSGSVNVSGTGETVNLAFSPARYFVELNETGLPSGETFTAKIDGITHSIKTTGGFTLLAWYPALGNGTYSYSISHVAGWTAEPAKGSIKVKGASVFVNVEFVPSGVPYYGVTFAESGLGTQQDLWSVTIGKQVIWSYDTSLEFSLKNGTYKYAATSPLTGENVTGKVKVSGSAVTVDLEFSSSSPLGTPGGGATAPLALERVQPGARSFQVEDPAR